MDLTGKGWKDFIGLCLSIKDPKMLTEMFDLLLTPEEKESIALRTLIVKELLSQEKPQREMAKDLNVSIAKITRGSNAIKRMNAKFLKFVQEHLG